MSKVSDQMLLEKVNKLRDNIREFDSPNEFAFYSGIESVVGGDKTPAALQHFDNSVKLTYPELIAVDAHTGDPLDGGSQAVISYYGFTAIQSKVEKSVNEWVSFYELDDGRFYNKAFQGYTGDLLARNINIITAKKKRIISAFRAEAIDLGDLSFQVKVLPKVSLAMVVWLGDEDFPPSCKILFDRSVNSFLPTDACAIVGSMFTHRILKIANE